jgi:hypothetical protein
MTFQSILFERSGEHPGPPQPACFSDLHLDQIVAAVTDKRDEFELEGFFHEPLHDVDAVRYRQLVMRDLERDEVRDRVVEFGRGMARMRECLAIAQRLRHRLQKQRWFLEAVAVYTHALSAFDERLAAVELRSDGMIGWRAYLTSHVQSAEFASLVADTDGVVNALDEIRYTVHVKGNRVRVSEYENEPDLSEQIQETFSRFRRGKVTDHRARLPDYADMNHVEAQIVELVARLNPETFSMLDQYCTRRERYLDETIRRFDREVQFYLAYLSYIAALKASGLPFCYPRVSARAKDVDVRSAFDLALASKLVSESHPVVCNEVRLTSPERILVVSGPNNGGKTTYARMFGQLHHLASLGLPVPGRQAKLFLPDRIFTHFEREEDIATLRGKFEDELVRIREILEEATGQSVLVMNESFGSTTLHDALVVGTAVVRQVVEMDALCVFVTFVDELSALGATTVSMMSTVVPDDPAVRTFKVVRKPADGLAYATAIAEKYGLTHDSLLRRVSG